MRIPLRKSEFKKCSIDSVTILKAFKVTYRSPIGLRVPLAIASLAECLYE